MLQTARTGAGGAPALLREHNEQVVLAALRERGALSRAALASVVGLSKPTVATVLADLEASGLVVGAGVAPGRSGPAAPLFAANPRAGLVGAVDIGRAYLRVAVADLEGQVVARADERNRARSASALLAQLADLTAHVATRAGAGWADLVVTVVGSPGVVDRASDRLLLADQLPGWGRQGLVQELRQILGQDLVIENDINLAVVGERAEGGARGSDDVVLLSFGTGVGMGIVLGGRLHRGRHGAAGEIAYVPVGLDAGLEAPSWRAREGSAAGVEGVSSAAALVREARAAGLPQVRTPADVFAAARAGDPVAVEVAGRQAERIGRVVAAVSALFDPDVVLLGGGLSRSLDVMREDVLRVAGRHAPLPPRLEAAQLDDAATLLGAVHTALPLAYARLMSAHVRARTGAAPAAGS